MNIPDKIKRSIEKRLEEIKLNTFSSDTVKLLLIEVREYLPQSSPLREIAHFVAHPERDRGAILETVNYAYNRSRVLFRQLDGNKSGEGLELNIDQLPVDIYETVVWHFSRIKPNASKLTRFRRSFAFDKAIDLYRPRRLITEEVIKHIREAIGIVSLQTAFSQEDVVRELSSAVKNVGLGIYSAAIHEQQNQIMICILSMLHQSLLILKDGNTAEAYLSSDSILDDEGKVFLAAAVKTDLSHASIAFTLISSQVTIKESFTDSMFDFRFGVPHINLKREDNIEAVRDDKGTIAFVKHAKEAERIDAPDR
jgi:hypothetical protein